MPDRMPDRMPEDMSDRMPEDLPVRKCINVMVGIIRSEVILLLFFVVFIATYYNNYYYYSLLLLSLYNQNMYILYQHVHINAHCRFRKWWTYHCSPVGESTAPPHRSCRVGAMERNQTQATDLVRSVHMEICDQPNSPRFTKGYTWCYQTISHL